MEQLDRMSLEDKVFAGDASMTGAKNKMLIRDTKKELMRYANATETTQIYPLDNQSRRFLFNFREKEPDASDSRGLAFTSQSKIMTTTHKRFILISFIYFHIINIYSYTVLTLLLSDQIYGINSAFLLYFVFINKKYILLNTESV